MEELRAWILRKQMTAKLTNAQVFQLCILLFHFHHYGFLVDCEEGPWEPWGKCSVTCGDGIKTRIREVVHESKNGGAACLNLEETEDCKTEKCSGTLFVPTKHIAFAFSSRWILAMPSMPCYMLVLLKLVICSIQSG